ncbi:cyclic nucleotide-binding domain-containing protein 1 [Hipposideros larvatus]
MSNANSSLLECGQRIHFYKFQKCFEPLIFLSLKMSKHIDYGQLNALCHTRGLQSSWNMCTILSVHNKFIKQYPKIFVQDKNRLPKLFKHEGQRNSTKGPEKRQSQRADGDSHNIAVYIKKARGGHSLYGPKESEEQLEEVLAILKKLPIYRTLREHNTVWKMLKTVPDLTSQLNDEHLRILSKNVISETWVKGSTGSSGGCKQRSSHNTGLPGSSPVGAGKWGACTPRPRLPCCTGLRRTGGALAAPAAPPRAQARPPGARPTSGSGHVTGTRAAACRVVGESVGPLHDLPLRGAPGRQQQADVVTRGKQATWHFSGEGPRCETSGDFPGPFSSDRLNAVSCRVPVVPAPAGSVRGLLRMTPSEKALLVGSDGVYVLLKGLARPQAQLHTTLIEENEAATSFVRRRFHSVVFSDDVGDAARGDVHVPPCDSEMGSGLLGSEPWLNSPGVDSGRWRCSRQKRAQEPVKAPLVSTVEPQQTHRVAERTQPRCVVGRAPQLRPWSTFGTLEVTAQIQVESKEYSVVTEEDCEILKIPAKDYAKLKSEKTQLKNKQIVKLIQKCPYYEEWPTLSIYDLVLLVKWKRFPPGHVIVESGNIISFVAYINSGYCNVYRNIVGLVRLQSKKVKKIQKLVYMGQLNEKQSFGEISVLRQVPFTCTVITGKEVEMAVIEDKDLFELDPVTQQLMLQTAKPTFDHLTDEDVKNEYLQKEQQKEWNDFKDKTMKSSLYYNGIIPGFGKWDHYWTSVPKNLKDTLVIY